MNVFLLVLLIASIGQFAAEIYLPSFPAITHAFKTTENYVQFTVAIYLCGYGISPLIYGPLSDHFGRRKPLFVGLLFCCIGTIICLTAQSVVMLIIGRLVQGIGVGAGSTTSRSIIRDLFSGERLAKVSSYFSIFNVGIMVTAPVIGGYIQTYLNWRFNFGFLLLYLLILTTIIFLFLPETNPHIKATELNFKNTIAKYSSLLHNKVFLGYAICVGLCYGGIIAYITAMPFLMQDIIGLTPKQFGWLAFINACLYMLGCFTNAQLLSYFKAKQLMVIGICIMFLGGLSMFLLGVKYINFWVIMIPLVIFDYGTGFIFGNGFSCAITPFPKMAGTSGSLMAAIQILIGATISALISLIYESSQLPLAIALISCSILCSVFLLLTLRENG